ncbi:type IV pilus twitching motility protein PilT [Pectinatus frisingensis]|uniref:type IV pilus twitching motility protein PilT n=1 Tax=Pectinatus frisingensis TaxID=865 RepID=UPI0018C594C8|nr:PilT/PilU family type 4a pilus ATPase [Pectinatus frisingensis]
MKSLNEMISIADKYGASDIHLVTGLIPTMRKNGLIANLDENDSSVFTSEASKNIIDTILNKYQKNSLEDKGDANLSYTCQNIFEREKILRTRVNVFKDLRGYSFALRLINENIPTMQELLLPRSIQSLIKKEHGLIVVTGPTGSGKNTTIASMLETINNTKNIHILTIEDPVEYYYKSKKSLISQREVGENCISFSAGLKAALREDPDVILVGEMRDAETIEMALAAAETGHLVLTTLHTADVVQSIDRMMQYFPANQQAQIRMQLANSFEGIIAQKLFLKNGGGRVAAFEILLRTPATVNLIRTGRAFELQDYMSNRDGMQTMDESITDLKRRNYLKH